MQPRTPGSRMPLCVTTSSWARLLMRTGIVQTWTVQEKNCVWLCCRALLHSGGQSIVGNSKMQHLHCSLLNKCKLGFIAVSSMKMSGQSSSDLYISLLHVQCGLQCKAALRVRLLALLTFLLDCQLFLNSFLQVSACASSMCSQNRP